MSDERVKIRYDSDDPAVVMLPADAEASPSGRVSPGDVVEVSAAFADIALATNDDGSPRDPRFSEADADAELSAPDVDPLNPQPAGAVDQAPAPLDALREAADPADGSRWAKATGAQLRAYLDSRGVDYAKRATVPALRELAVEQDLAQLAPTDSVPSDGASDNNEETAQ